MIMFIFITLITLSTNATLEYDFCKQENFKPGFCSLYINNN